jgi:Zn-finger nucleic acid-binding protein
MKKKLCHLTPKFETALSKIRKKQYYALDSLMDCKGSKKKEKNGWRISTMKCPVCSDVRMREVEKGSVLIDVCPDCKGVWLDRGELDKLMTGIREARNEYDRMERHVSNDDKYERQYNNDDRSHSSQGHKEYEQHGKPYKKKKNMMDVFGDLFD